MSKPNMPRQKRMEALVARSTNYEPGYFYFFLRLPGPMEMGHMGWGFRGGDGVSYHCGSLENVSGWMIRGGGRYGDNLGAYWTTVVRGEQAMLQEMMDLPTAKQALNLGEMSPYTYYKKVLVADPNVGRAVTEAEKWRSGTMGGFGSTYSVIAQNCLDNAREVGVAYGIDRSSLPLRFGADAIPPAGFFNSIEGEMGVLYNEKAARELARVQRTAAEVDRLDAEWERLVREDPYANDYERQLRNQNSRLYAYRKLKGMLEEHSTDREYADMVSRYTWGFGRPQGSLDESIRLLETR